MKNYYLINHDVFFISERIKEIDSGYFIVFNAQKQKYEVHNISQKFGTYCLTLPYDCLDERALTYTLKTRFENVEKIIEQLDFENEQLQKNNLKQIRNKIEEVLL